MPGAARPPGPWLPEPAASPEPPLREEGEEQGGKVLALPVTSRTHPLAAPPSCPTRATAAGLEAALRGSGPPPARLGGRGGNPTPRRNARSRARARAVRPCPCSPVLPGPRLCAAGPTPHRPAPRGAPGCAGALPRAAPRRAAHSSRPATCSGRLRGSVSAQPPRPAPPPARLPRIAARAASARPGGAGAPVAPTGSSAPAPGLAPRGHRRGGGLQGQAASSRARGREPAPPPPAPARRREGALAGPGRGEGPQAVRAEGGCGRGIRRPALPTRTRPGRGGRRGAGGNARPPAMPPHAVQPPMQCGPGGAHLPGSPRSDCSSGAARRLRTRLTSAAFWWGGAGMQMRP